MSDLIENLRSRIEALNDAALPLDSIERLSVVNCSGLHHLEFYGDCFGQAYQDLCETLSDPEVAQGIVSISLRGPDEGANGTKNWNLEPLVANRHGFPNLQTLSVELNRPGDHNRIVIASSFDEDGVIARFVSRCPNLTYLTIPSAPSPDFFATPLKSLRFLSVDAGYDTQDFLHHLGNSQNLPSLKNLQWGEYSEYYLDDWRASCTPFADYKKLFSSSAFEKVKGFTLRQPNLATEQIAELQTARPDLQFMLIRHGSEYVKASNH